MTSFSDRLAWRAAAGTPTATEDFEEFSVDTTFGWVVVPLATGSITATGMNAWVNQIDVPPFSASHHGGTPYASCWVHEEDYDQIELGFANPVTAFGATFFDALDEGWLEISFLSGTSSLGTAAPASNGAAFLGVTSATPFDRAIFRSVALTQWEAFGLDDIEIVETCGAVAAYCTAGTTSNGCRPSISGAGTPSASAGSGFAIQVDAVEGARLGLIFYGVSGPMTAPWSPASTSYLCVALPVQRTAVQSSGGSAGACDGTLTLDWNAYIATHPGALGTPFGGGESVYAQGWFRDSGAPKGTNLSDGLRFTVCN